MHPPLSTLFPYTTLFRSASYVKPSGEIPKELRELSYEEYKDIRYRPDRVQWRAEKLPFELTFFHEGRSEEHTSELQSHVNLVCRLLLENNKLVLHAVKGY